MHSCSFLISDLSEMLITVTALFIYFFLSCSCWQQLLLRCELMFLLGGFPAVCHCHVLAHKDLAKIEGCEG